MRLKTLLSVLVLSLALTGSAYAGAFSPVMFGALSNFDVFNTTGAPTNGFEIELDNISVANVVYTFGGTYNRYGSPTVTQSGSNVLVDYKSPWDGSKYTAATPVPPSINPTLGHACWSGGGSVNGIAYLDAGCEHFGVSLTATPASTIYRWLVPSSTPGQLTPYGTNVPIPAPVVNVVPPAPAIPAQVQVVVPAPPAPSPAVYGDAQWEKVYLKENQDPGEVALDDLVLGNPAVPADDEIEIEWRLLQAGPGLADVEDDANLAPGNNAVVRRYEFYQYIGGYDPDNHQALCDTPDATCVGNYIGAQVIEGVLAPAAAVPEPRTVTLVAVLIVIAIVLSRRRHVH